MLQAEIFLQYGMKDKARERVERITKVYPQAEHDNEDFRYLMEKVGCQVSPAPEAQPAPADSAVEETRDIRSDLKRVSEISRDISRQGTIKGVLSSAVNDIGRFWEVSRCVIGLASPNRPPSMAMEYISPGVAASDPAHLGRMVMGLQHASAGKSFPLVAENVTEEPALAGLQEALKILQVDSLVSIPLRDGEQEIGIIVLQQCGNRRSWKGNDLAALEALGEQVVLAVANVRLRNLMKALAVTDEGSGLLHRNSYLTCLASETERMRTQKTPLTIALLRFANPELEQHEQRNDRKLQEFINQFSESVLGQLRQNDMAIKYSSETLALILPGATSRDAGSIMEKMRKLTVTTVAGTELSLPQMSVGVAEAIREGTMDNTNRVTELINRLDEALDEASRSGGNAVKILDPPALLVPGTA